MVGDAMGAPRLDGIVARQRKDLPRQRKSLRLELRISTYLKLLRLTQAGGDREPDSMSAVVERLIEQASKQVCTNPVDSSR